MAELKRPTDVSRFANLMQLSHSIIHILHVCIILGAAMTVGVDST